MTPSPAEEAPPTLKEIREDMAPSPQAPPYTPKTTRAPKKSSTDALDASPEELTEFIEAPTPPPVLGKKTLPSTPSPISYELSGNTSGQSSTTTSSPIASGTTEPPSTTTPNEPIIKEVPPLINYQPKPFLPNLTDSMKNAVEPALDAIQQTGANIQKAAGTALDAMKQSGAQIRTAAGTAFQSTTGATTTALNAMKRKWTHSKLSSTALPLIAAAIATGGTLMSLGTKKQQQSEDEDLQAFLNKIKDDIVDQKLAPISEELTEKNTAAFKTILTYIITNDDDKSLLDPSDYTRMEEYKYLLANLNTKFNPHEKGAPAIFLRGHSIYDATKLSMKWAEEYLKKVQSENDTVITKVDQLFDTIKQKPKEEVGWVTSMQDWFSKRITGGGGTPTGGGFNAVGGWSDDQVAKVTTPTAQNTALFKKNLQKAIAAYNRETRTMSDQELEILEEDINSYLNRIKGHIEEEKENVDELQRHYNFSKSMYEGGEKTPKILIEDLTDIVSKIYGAIINGGTQLKTINTTNKMFPNIADSTQEENTNVDYEEVE
ncbi:MAG: hypothetical protein WBQ73_00575, partial [Candidatus Babeliales bacterium]